MDKKTILIVEDSSSVIMLLSETLKEHGFETIIANSGREALRQLKTITPDLILLDVVMPEMDGYETCRLIKKNSILNEIPIIFLTSKTGIKDITSGFKLGGVDYIAKPFNKEELISRVNTHVELHLKRKELKELNAVKDKFFSIIAHDLRNPFNTLLGLTKTIIRQFDKIEKEKLRKSLDMLYNSSNNGYILLENLLTWSRTQRNKIEFEPQKFNIHEIIESNFKLVNEQALSKKISLSSDVPEKLMVFADKNMINTIIRNLLMNAIKFTRHGGNIRLFATKKNSSIILNVEDNGVGIPRSKIDKLFNLDTNQSTAGTAREKGTGLGLILCKEFIERHDEKIWVESEPDKGSTFSFSLKEEE